MIEIKSWINDSLNQESSSRVTLTNQLTPGELLWKPRPETAPIGWSFWRMTRIEDFWIQKFIRNREELWQQNSWYKRFGFERRSTGLGHSSGQMDQFPGVTIDDLMDYWNDVRIATLDFLTNLNLKLFDNIPRRKRPDMTIRAVFRHLIAELNQHLTHISKMTELIVEAKANINSLNKFNRQSSLRQLPIQTQ
jgi:hypothetical protein